MIVDRTKDLDVKLFFRDPARREMTPLTIDHNDNRVGGGQAARMIESLGHEGGEIAVRAVGPDAAKGAEVLRALFEGPIPSTFESLSAIGTWMLRTRRTIEEMKPKEMKPKEEVRLYLRFGEIPATGRSADWGRKPGSFLAGVSCFKACRIAEGEIEADVSSSLLLPVAFAKFSRKPLDAFLIEGRELEVRGPWGEPLLADATVLERLSPRPSMRTHPKSIFTDKLLGT